MLLNYVGHGLETYLPGFLAKTTFGAHALRTHMLHTANLSVKLSPVGHPVSEVAALLGLCNNLS